MTGLAAKHPILPPAFSSHAAMHSFLSEAMLLSVLERQQESDSLRAVFFNGQWTSWNQVNRDDIARRRSCMADMAATRFWMGHFDAFWGMGMWIWLKMTHQWDDFEAIWSMGSARGSMPR